MSSGRIPTTANSPITAKGDLFTYSTAPARLAVGSNGESLVADSAATTGLRYSATPSASNPVINSAMQIAQRGTSISLAASAGTTYTLDRWCTQTGANQACTVTQELTGDTTNLPFIQYAQRYKRNTSQTGTGALTLLNAFETVNSRPFAGKPVTLSFYARAGANYSAASSALAVKLDSGTGTDQNPFAGYTGAATVASTTATLTTTWQRFSATGTVGATATELNVQVVFTPVGTAGAADYYEITGVQVDVGSVALPFRTYAATIQGELANCQRYYWRITADASYSRFSMPAPADGTTSVHCGIPAPTYMRNMVSLEYANCGLIIGGSVIGITSMAFSGNQNGYRFPVVQVTTTGLTNQTSYSICASNSLSAYLAINAEL